jgi:hypothetical protein
VDYDPVNDHYLVAGGGGHFGYGLHSVVSMPGTIHPHHDRSKHRYPFLPSSGARRHYAYKPA